MKTVQLYFSAKNPNNLENHRAVFHKEVCLGWVRAVLISDCDITHAIMKGRVHAKPNEVFVGAVAIE